jgi:DNA polymerase I
MPKLILIDGNAILHRAYHSLPPFKTSRGETTNAIYGFLRMLFDIYVKVRPDYLGIAWDRKAPTFRHTEYKEYKATRAAPPEDLYPQLPRLKQVLETFHIPMLEMDGYEADDMLGTAASNAEKTPDLETLIVTGDQDTLQLVHGNTRVMAPIKGISEVTIYDADAVKAKFGVTPEQIIDYKALCGDTSDNIPGVPGIGPKQASELLQKYGTLNAVYDHLEDLTPARRRKLEDGRESAYMSQKIATIQLDAPITFNLDDFRTHRIDYDKANAFFQELEFRSLGKKLDEVRAMLESDEIPGGHRDSGLPGQLQQDPPIKPQKPEKKEPASTAQQTLF